MKVDFQLCAAAPELAEAVTALLKLVHYAGLGAPETLAKYRELLASFEEEKSDG